MDALKRGERLPLRMAVIDRLETIGFDLEAVDAREGQARVRMKPSSILIALAVAPIDFTFDPKKALAAEPRRPSASQSSRT